MQIGLALSGGGFRATVFHLGVMGRLAAEDLLQQVDHLATVSGGSLCAGLVYHTNQYRWPTPDEFTQQVVPEIAQLLTQTNLQRRYLQGILRDPLSLFRHRANDMAFLIRQLWGMEASLQDLPGAGNGPHWDILTTCYESGKIWYFNKERMGDYLLGYSFKPDVPLSQALAASAAVPGIIGPLAFDTNGFEWMQFQRGQPPINIKPEFDRVHLWDGGVYDNLGLEPLTNYSSKSGHYEFREGIDFLIVSDSSGLLNKQTYPVRFRLTRSFMRLADVMKDQIQALRSRALIGYFKLDEHEFPPGRYFQIDNFCVQMMRRSYKSQSEAEKCCEDYFSAEKALQLANMETTLRQLTPAEFGDLYRHGFEVADVTLHAFDAERFQLIGYHAADHPYFSDLSMG